MESINPNRSQSNGQNEDVVASVVVEIPASDSLDAAKNGSEAKGKQRTWKKPPGKPKRPLSAYNIFFQLERDRIVNGEQERSFTKDDVAKVRVVTSDQKPKRRDRKIHGKVAFTDLAKLIGLKWKSLDEQERLIFEDRAKIEKVKYLKDVAAWAKSKSAPSPNMVNNTLQGEIDLSVVNGTFNLDRYKTGGEINDDEYMWHYSTTTTRPGTGFSNPFFGKFNKELYNFEDEYIDRYYDQLAFDSNATESTVSPASNESSQDIPEAQFTPGPSLFLQQSYDGTNDSPIFTQRLHPVRRRISLDSTMSDLVPTARIAGSRRVTFHPRKIRRNSMSSVLPVQNSMMRTSSAINRREYNRDMMRARRHSIAQQIRLAEYRLLLNEYSPQNANRPNDFLPRKNSPALNEEEMDCNLISTFDEDETSDSFHQSELVAGHSSESSLSFFGTSPSFVRFPQENESMDINAEVTDESSGPAVLYEYY